MEITRESLKAIMCDTRLKILKSLSQRRKTLSELSRELGLAFSTMKEHLDKLVEVGLIVKVDDGHKWKYYELTPTGQKLLSPRLEIVLIFSSILLIVIGTFGIVFQFSKPILQIAYTSEKLAGTPGLIQKPSSQELGAFNPITIVFLILVIIGIGILLNVYIRRSNRIAIK
jgi:DNA-binding transcriptional ArsR family regulator